MPRLEFVIEFPPSAEIIHRVRNFAEDLSLRLSRANIGTVADIDTVTEKVHVFAAASRHLGEVSEQIQKALTKHRFVDQATVTRAR